MAIGQVAETVTVTGSTPIVETRNLGVGQVMDNKRILELPLNGRNTADLLAVLPAAVPQPALNATSRSMGGSSGGIAYSLAGGVSFGVSFVLDGATHNNPYDNLNLPLPFPDAIGEFKAETSALTAQNGMHSGAAVNAITKSGSNSFRGDGFEFFRHHSMNATGSVRGEGRGRQPQGRRAEAQSVRRHARRSAHERSAVLLRRLSGYEYSRQFPTDNRAFVPTAAMLAGDFTAFAVARVQRRPSAHAAAPRLSDNKVSP